jgi:YVTN family beta-propeller protein
MAAARSAFWGATLGLCGLAACLAVSASRLAAPALAPPPLLRTARLRRPVAAVLLADGRTLWVANQRSGTLSLVDLSGPRVCAEVAVGQHLSGLTALPDGKHLLAVDDERHELIALSLAGARLAVLARLKVGPSPASVLALNGTRATVASTWSRRLQVVDLTTLSSLRVRHTLRLPFAPREQCVLPGGSRVVVADAFGGHLAVIDVVRGRLLGMSQIRGHNIRSLVLSSDRKHLLLSHQVLDQKAATTRPNIERGVLMANVVRALPLDRLPGARAGPEKGRLIRLGSPGAGAGDPAGLVPLDGGRLAVALAGVNEVALVGADGKTSKRIAVGRRPTALLLPGKSGPLVVLNTFADSLSLLEPRTGVVRATVPLGPQPELSCADRGELLFYDARLAPAGWLSCHSCHTDGHSNGLLADTHDDDTFGTPKRTLTLLGTRLTDPWGWAGRARYLHDQVRKSLVETVHTPALTEDHVGDLTTFLSGLPPPPPLEPVRSEEDREQVERGRSFFARRRCGSCHIPPLTYSSVGVYDVGFADERGLRKFNPPSLRGVGQGYRFLHDNRAATLEEVFTKYHHKVPADTPPEDIEDLVRFLRSL